MQNRRDRKWFYPHAHLHELPKAKHGLKKCRVALWRIAHRQVHHMHVNVVNVDHGRFTISHVNHLVLPVGEPVDCLRSTSLEPPLQPRGIGE